MEIRMYPGEKIGKIVGVHPATDTGKVEKRMIAIAYHRSLLA